MNICDKCPAPCCDSPIIKGPNSGMEQLIDWMGGSYGEYKKGQNIDTFIKRMREEIEKALIPNNFFAGTENSDRKLKPHTIELEVSEEEHAILFLFRVFFLCPEYSHGKCENYEDRPHVCRNFLCEDAGGNHASREKISDIKARGEDNFSDIDSAIQFIRDKISLL